MRIITLCLYILILSAIAFLFALGIAHINLAAA
jgi:hypothetical protein